MGAGILAQALSDDALTTRQLLSTDLGEAVKSRLKNASSYGEDDCCEVEAAERFDDWRD